MQGAPLVEVGDDVNASGALLVSCFPSVGFVSSIVAHFMVETKKVKSSRSTVCVCVFKS